MREADCVAAAGRNVSMPTASSAWSTIATTWPTAHWRPGRTWDVPSVPWPSAAARRPDLPLYFTSHGSAEHELVLSQPRLSLDDLPARDLAGLLAPLAGRKAVVVISACYSGGFIEPLKNQQTLIMTAARADRVSFGCSEQSDFTYFGPRCSPKPCRKLTISCRPSRSLRQGCRTRASRRLSGIGTAIMGT